MQNITPCLWFDKNCEEAMNFYVKTFQNSPSVKGESKILSKKYYPENSSDEHMKGMEGKILTGIFTLAGQRFMALDGGPVFKFNEAISLMVECDDQAEVDYFWDKLSAAPESEQCGWLKDKFGLSWQIIPKTLGILLNSQEKEKSMRALNAMLQMKKIDINELQKAFDGKK